MLTSLRSSNFVSWLQGHNTKSAGKKYKKSKRSALESDSHGCMSTKVSDNDQPGSSQAHTSLKSKVCQL